ncbi:S-adenosylmethionine-dependent methyltransferase [Mycolicibacterium sarraceniae]|uniref:S-adenosylmethionine-dependent methyltransferase n=1 Tax=Mycolicibacterium sarraceniae TaxID=1534348 RepID=A0A7I7SKI3_9MYCO|nr:S-adenosylmethionine-dependent methyltransferase [Mycolicibacterium sarraceniae]
MGRAEVAYLTSDAGVAALAEVAEYPLSDRSRVADIAAIRNRFAERGTALIETTLLRRKAVIKLAGLADVSGWLFTDDALQQATAAPVARHRAVRLAGAVVHDATCSIGTELAALRSTAAWVLGSDIDEVRVAMARHNVPDVALCRADALHPVSRDAVVLLDPARRSGGRRRFDPRAYVPPLDGLLDTYRGRATVVKCAPGIDFDAVRHLGFDGEIEVTSAGGSVREACLWSPALAEPGVRRRACVLDRDEVITDADPDDCPAGPAGRWIVDPDGAIVRAGLVRHYAARHGLWQLDPDIAYLTGDHVPPGVRGFEVLDELPLREKVLRQALSQHDCGQLEILVRGVDVDPDALRRRLRVTGRTPLSLVITRIGSGAGERTSVFLCRVSAGT